MLIVQPEHAATVFLQPGVNLHQLFHLLHAPRAPGPPNVHHGDPVSREQLLARDRLPVQIQRFEPNRPPGYRLISRCRSKIISIFQRLQEGPPGHLQIRLNRAAHVRRFRIRQIGSLFPERVQEMILRNGYVIKMKALGGTQLHSFPVRHADHAQRFRKTGFCYQRKTRHHLHRADIGMFFLRQLRGLFLQRGKLFSGHHEINHEQCRNVRIPGYDFNGGIRRINGLAKGIRIRQGNAHLRHLLLLSLRLGGGHHREDQQQAQNHAHPFFEHFDTLLRNNPLSSVNTSGIVWISILFFNRKLILFHQA